MRRCPLFLFTHRLLAILRWDLHFLLLRLCNALTLQTWRIGREIARRPRPLYLNLGSGPKGLSDPHWINVDGFPDTNVHHLIDFGRPLPFGDATFAGVFCEHVLEHFSLEDGERIAREVRRVLCPSGGFRVVVPDGALIMRKYFRGTPRTVPTSR